MTTENKNLESKITDAFQTLEITANETDIQNGFSDNKDFKLALLGNVDSGKSTLVGVLSRGLLDDGQGKARSFILRHNHEHERGQTSSVATELIGFSSSKQIIPPSVLQSNQTALNTASKHKPKVQHVKEFNEIASLSKYRCSLIDLCGHEKYLKTTIHGLCGLGATCALILIGGSRGVQKMTREHIGLCCELNIPFFIALTKVDRWVDEISKEKKNGIKWGTKKKQEVEMRLVKILSKVGRKPFYIQKEEDLEKGKKMVFEKFRGSKVPVFRVSSVTGEGIDYLRSFVQTLTQDFANSDTETATDEEKPWHEFLIDQSFQVAGAGLVVSGNLASGSTLSVGDKLLLGPSKQGQFYSCRLNSIQRHCVPSKFTHLHQPSTLGLKPFAINIPKNKPIIVEKHLKKDLVDKGMVIIKQDEEEKLNIIEKNTTRFFEADVRILHHTTTINPGYCPMVHIGPIKQAGKFLIIRDKDGRKDISARTGNKVIVIFEFRSPVFLRVGSQLVFREGTATGCGSITKLLRQQDIPNLSQH
eukprot:maker-scaffold_22-snap-gene-1.48-mRNA-1 protein AED:0.02 eAED:0.02 QI:63/1/1/1/1/1/3/129/530